MKRSEDEEGGLRLDSAMLHELRTPLNQIVGYSEILAEDGSISLRPDLLGDLDKIRQAARTIDRLLASMAEEGKGRRPTSDSTAEPTIGRMSGSGRTDETDVEDRSGADGRCGCAGQENAASVGPGHGRILVVDDNEANGDLLRRRLGRCGHHVTIAENGLEALECLRREPFDLVLLDIMMPELDGFQTLRSMRNDPELRNVPVIVVSAQTELDNVVRCIEMGAEDYLTKPFNPTLLHARVEASLEKKRLREQEQQHREQALRAEATIERHRSLAEMVAGVAHEINTPLGIASTALSVIENRLSSQAIRTALAGNGRDREFLEDVLSAADLLKKNVLRAHKLVETFKKISVNQITDTLEKVNVSSLLSDAVELFQLNARQARLSINIDCSGVKGGNEWVGYPGYLTQVIMNFLQNIERYAYPAGSGGKVDVRLTDDGQGEAGDFSLLVRDYGRGIAPGDLGKVFDPFFTTGRSRGGTGLGLAIVDTIVRSVLKGQIAVTSEFGKETCFKLTFPKNLGDTPERKGAGSIHVTGDEAEDGASSAESRGRGTSSS